MRDKGIFLGMLNKISKEYFIKIKNIKKYKVKLIGKF